VQVHDYCFRSTAEYPGKTALVCGDQRLTYRDIADRARSLSHYLVSAGLQKGDRVGIFLDNCPDAVVSVFGVLAAGGCIVLINHTARADGVSYILGHCGAKYLIAPAVKAEIAVEAMGRCAVPPSLLLAGEVQAGAGISFNDICAARNENSLPPVHIISTDLAAIIYTSGSTGKPKGVTLTHLNIDTVVESVVSYLENRSDDVILCLLQLSFGYGLLQLLATFRTGARLVLEKGYGYPYEVVKRIKTERVTGFAGAPTLYAMLLQLQSLEQEDFSCLRYITNAAAALPPSFVPKLRKVFPTTKIYLMHGQTECLRTTYLPPAEVELKPTSVGTGMPNVELWAEDSEGHRAAPGVVGEMVVRGANVMQGYWNDPVASDAVLRPGRYPWERTLHTRDLFTQDKDGYFYFVARTDDIIKCRGEKVSPLEIEDLIYTLDEVLEVRVIGVPDDLLGQAIRAEIVLKPGAELAEPRVKAFIRSHLEDYKVPKTVAFVESLPKSAGGKIRRTATPAA
jgi:long-chain acyl-CoA synthetase